MRFVGNPTFGYQRLRKPPLRLNKAIPGGVTPPPPPVKTFLVIFFTALSAYFDFSGDGSIAYTPSGAEVTTGVTGDGLLTLNKPFAPDDVNVYGAALEFVPPTWPPVLLESRFELDFFGTTNFSIQIGREIGYPSEFVCVNGNTQWDWPVGEDTIDVWLDYVDAATPGMKRFDVWVKKSLEVGFTRACGSSPDFVESTVTGFRFKFPQTSDASKVWIPEVKLYAWI